MVLDMSGFSRTTKTQGMVPFLLMIRQMKLVAAPGSTGRAEEDT